VFALILNEKSGDFVVLTTAEKSVLDVYRKFLMSRGEMLCFNGTNLKKHKPAIGQLIKKGMLIEESFKGGYSLTNDGYKAMKAHRTPGE